jgi:4-carboxymuconolactone decarboxylase
MSRIPLAAVDQQPDAIREFIARRGELNVFRLLANVPHVFIGWSQMIDELLDSPTFSPRIRELIILRVAHLQDSSYELSQHLELGRSAGLTDAEINAVTGDLGAAEFSGRECAVLELITELCTTRRLREDTFGAAHAALGDACLTELLMLISCYYGLAPVLNAADLDRDPTTRLHV